MKPETALPYLYVPSSHGSGMPPSYVSPRQYVRTDHATLEKVAIALKRYEKDQKGNDEKKSKKVRISHKRADYPHIKGDILKMLERLAVSAPIAPEREPLLEAWSELKAGHAKDTAAHDFLRMHHQLELARHGLVPDAIKADSHTMAGLRDKNILNQLQHIREVYDACADEAARGQRELSKRYTPNLLKLERRMGMGLALAQLDSEIGGERAACARDMGALLDGTREERLHSAVARCLGQFEAHMDARYRTWRGKKVQVPPDSVLNAHGETTLGELVRNLGAAATGEALKPYAELLHHVVAKQAYYFKRDLVKAYDADYEATEKTIYRQNAQSIADIRFSDNPFDQHQELIAAAYNAKWGAMATKVMRQMKRFERTLEDPAIIPIEPGAAPRRQVQTDGANVLGAVSKNPKGRRNGA